MTLEQCKVNCKSTDAKFSCTNGVCNEREFGTMTLEECQSNCANEHAYGCVSATCQKGAGILTFEECEIRCAALGGEFGTSGYNCVQGTCEFADQGVYASKDECTKSGCGSGNTQNKQSSGASWGWIFLWIFLVIFLCTGSYFVLKRIKRKPTEASLQEPGTATVTSSEIPQNITTTVTSGT